MTERAQALEAVIAYLDAIDEIATIGAAPKHHTGQSAMPPPYNMTPSTAKNIKWNTREIRSRLALLAVQPPPPVGSPTTENIPQPVQRFDLVSVSFAYTSDHEMQRSDDGEWVRFDDVFPPAALSPVEPTVHNDLCSWCLTQADHVAASEECYERNSERGRITTRPPVEPAGASEPPMEREDVGQHQHEFAEVEVCRHCLRTEADIEGTCHHCDEGTGARCWWCLKLKSASAQASDPPKTWIPTEGCSCYLCRAARFSPTPVSPVEPEPPAKCDVCFTAAHCHRHRRCLAECMPDDLKPTGAPAPCVWRDIESAPKDGTHILTHHEEGYEICWWQDAQPDAPDDMGHDAGWFGSVYSFPGRSFGNPSHFSESQGQPTHWMPLPVAPLKVER